jgi:hypothetical protein
VQVGDMGIDARIFPVGTIPLKRKKRYSQINVNEVSIGRKIEPVRKWQRAWTWR